MSISVCKFGGSSMADAGMFVRVLRIIRDDPARRYIVLSAPGKRTADDDKITDLFYRAYEEPCHGDNSILARIFHRYASIRDALAPDFDLEAEFAQIRAKLHTSRDFAASRGEYLCAKLFAAYANIPFVDAHELLYFDSEGNVDHEKSRCAVRQKLSRLDHAVIPGFYGAHHGGGIRTFSRGGSDVSGALISAYLNADLYENWTDVDGLYTADPNIVCRPQRNMQISLYQMEQIANEGAQLLHPEALKPLKGTGIDTLLKNTFQPGADGTRISESCTQPARCVTGRRRMYMIGDIDPHGEVSVQPLLHPLPLPGSLSVSVVSAFGLTDKAKHAAAMMLKPIHIIHMQDYIEIITAEKEYETTIRTIHDILMKQ